MPSCNQCGQFILFGGTKVEDRRYCNQTCASAGEAIHAVPIPQLELDRLVREVHQGNCPKCQGPGPVDVHTSHRAMSFLVITNWSSHPQLCCRSCGTKARLWNTCVTGILGWWGFPWGFIMTPIQLARNVGGLFGGPNPEVPSTELVATMRRVIAARRQG